MRCEGGKYGRKRFWIRDLGIFMRKWDQKDSKIQKERWQKRGMQLIIMEEIILKV